MCSQFNLITRIQSLLRDGISLYGGIRKSDVSFVKTAKPGTSKSIEDTTRAIMKWAGSQACRECIKAIEKDKARLIKELGDKTADPSPLPSTIYATEAEAVLGCATPPNGGALLYGVIRVLQPRHCIEIGGAHGYGAAYIGFALQDNGHGQLISLEGMAARIMIAAETIKRFNLSRQVEIRGGDFEMTLPPSLRESASLDFVFSDGGKLPDLTLSQFYDCAETMPNGGYMLFDDIRHNDEIRLIWNKIVSDHRVLSCVTFYNRWGLLQVSPIQGQGAQV
jgi:predicted O-methyltransferase YrrM